MDGTVFVTLFREFFYKGFEIMLPALLVSLIIVVIIAVLMTVMGIQEPSLTFLPKLFGFVFVLAVLGPWMFDSLVTLIGDTWDRIPKML